MGDSYMASLFHYGGYPAAASIELKPKARLLVLDYDHKVNRMGQDLDLRLGVTRVLCTTENDATTKLPIQS